jgi:hypothetical protein
MAEFRLDARLKERVSSSDVLQEAYIDAFKLLPHYRAHHDLPFFVWARAVTLQRLAQVHRHHLGVRARDAAKEVAVDWDTLDEAGLGGCPGGWEPSLHGVRPTGGPKSWRRSGKPWAGWPRAIARSWRYAISMS